MAAEQLRPDNLDAGLLMWFLRRLHRAKGCRSRSFGAGQTFLELDPRDVNLTRNETAAVTETVVTFLLPVGAPITVDVPAPNCQP